uniref:Ig-like domain-containing protein n=1 Tax=Timema monikensis TaxID=170555 RepID=A0A7R9HMW2_9NEOP|nr:unnamed protein product [Timema monikensis]
MGEVSLLEVNSTSYQVCEYSKTDDSGDGYSGDGVVKGVGGWFCRPGQHGHNIPFAEIVHNTFHIAQLIFEIRSEGSEINLKRASFYSRSKDEFIPFGNERRRGLVSALPGSDITNISQEQTKEVGSSTTLECSTTNAESLVMWLKYDTNHFSNPIFISAGTALLVPDYRYSLVNSIENKTFMLKISDLQVSDTGTYKCRVTNLSTNNTFTADVNMTVRVREPVYILDNSTSSIVVRQRESVQLECYAGGYPSPRVYWRRENMALFPSGESIFRGNILTIQSVTKFDRGRYYCLADNGGNMTARHTVTLRVMFPPNVEGPTPGSENDTLIENVGGTLKLECTTRDSEEYPVIWVKVDPGNPTFPNLLSIGSSLIFYDNRYNVRSINRSTIQLKIWNLQLSDAGTYQCLVSIAKGVMLIADLIVTVREPAYILDNSTSSVVAHQGDLVLLECHSRGTPPPRVHWRKENKGSVLNISSIRTEDRGLYSCTAENGAEDPAQWRASVHVHFAPILTVSQPQVRQALNHSMDMECRVQAYPAPVITWAKDGVQLSDSQQHSTSQYSTAEDFLDTVLRVLITDSDQYGNYTCNAANDLGRAEGQIELLEVSEPVCPPACNVPQFNITQITDILHN